jgi:lysophospholipase L1-like esterase
MFVVRCSVLMFGLVAFTVSVTVAAGQPLPVIVMLGDSTTAERPGAIERVYATRVEETLAESGLPVKVINAGVGGNSTDDGLGRFDKDVLAHHPDLVVIQFGINDSAVDVWRTPPATDPRVPIERFEANLRQMIERSRRSGSRVVLMTTNPIRWTPKLKELYGKFPYNPDRADGFDTPLLSRYNEVVRRIAKELAVPLVDVHTEFRQREVEPLLLDGMHPNDAGHATVAKFLSVAIRDQMRPAR